MTISTPSRRRMSAMASETFMDVSFRPCSPHERSDMRVRTCRTDRSADDEATSSDEVCVRKARQQIDGADLVEDVRRALALLAREHIAGRDRARHDANPGGCPNAAHNPESTSTTQHGCGASPYALSVAQSDPRVTA